MIILDTCVIRGMRLDGSEADLLRAIRETGRERVAVPWMVLEELAAQKVIEYGEAHQEATRALRQLRKTAPGDVPDIGDPDPDAVRDHWREQRKQLVEVLETSEAALREGVYREANALRPAGMKKGVKSGARDVAIWLSAVEYARAHPNETVYFVSSNTNDFTDGSAYPHPMDADLEGIRDRFVHLTSLSELLKRLAPPVEVDARQVEKLLPPYAEYFRDAALARWGAFGSPKTVIFPALSKATGETGSAYGWVAPKTLQLKPLAVTEVQGYRLGEHDWCTATVQWQFIGLTLMENTVVMACCTWVTRVLMPLVEDGPSPRILSAGLPEAPTNGQTVDWPTSPLLKADYQGLKAIDYDLATRFSSDPLALMKTAVGKAFADFYFASMRGENAVTQFRETELEAKIRANVEADAAHEVEWDAGDTGLPWNDIAD